MQFVKRILRWLCAVGLLAVGVGVLYAVISSSPDAVNKDSTQYWASGRLLLQHANPYDDEGVFRLEKEAGAPVTHAHVMFNPPTALFLALPLGLFAPRTAIFLWALMIVACVVTSIRILWIMHGRRTDRLHLLAYVFAPVMACITIGQVPPVELLGLVLFLKLNQTRPLLAGLSFSLLAIKPHLLLPFGLVALIWAIKGRRYSFIGGVSLGLLTALCVPIYFDRQIFAHYLPVLRTANGYSHGMPNLSSLVHSLHQQAGYLQYLLAFSATCWAVWWFIRRQNEWDWNDEGLLLIVVSVAAAPYSWFFDEALVIPAILSGIYGCYDADKSLLSFGLLNGAALALALFNVQLITGAYIWTSTAWLVWFLYARSIHRLSEKAVYDSSLSTLES
ncbi:MAG: DUF2029 domain-containing protein [Acidobacteriota bacterium]|nr:DUF2029 domain-containing protein [Acidobacteriota bacterium]